MPYSLEHFSAVRIKDNLDQGKNWKMDGEDLFAFCIPLIAREKSKNWQMVLDNLQATLQSMLKQSDRNFIVNP